MRSVDYSTTLDKSRPVDQGGLRLWHIALLDIEIKCGMGCAQGVLHQRTWLSTIDLNPLAVVADALESSDGVLGLSSSDSSISRSMAEFVAQKKTPMPWS